MTMTRPERVRAQVRAPRPEPPTAPVPVVTRPHWRGAGGDAIAVLSIVCLWVLLQTLLLGGLSEHRAQAEGYSRLRTQLAAATAPAGGVIPLGAPVALLRIPALHRELVVIEGTASGDLVAGPGHRRDTPLPGQQGVSLVYGKARTYGAPFADVTDLRPGARIVARTGQGRAVFVVDRVRRAGDPVPAAPPGGGARLTLVTAESAGALAAVSAGTVVYVDATMQQDGFVAPSGRLTGVPDSERAMGVDTAALPLLVVALGAVLVLVLGAVLARQRWSAALVWVIAVPLVVAVAWAATDVAVRLLPNLL